jgi:hypothetical protein
MNKKASALQTCKACGRQSFHPCDSIERMDACLLMKQNIRDLGLVISEPTKLYVRQISKGQFEALNEPAMRSFLKRAELAA